MQNFLPFSDFVRSTECLDYRRHGNQRKETFECLCILYDYKPDFITDKWWTRIVRHKNHPAVRMWRGYEIALIHYGYDCCITWHRKGYKDSWGERFYNLVINNHISNDQFIDYDKPKWLGSDRLHASHKSNLIRKYPEHYRPIFGDDVPDNLPYYWPV